MRELQSTVSLRSRRAARRYVSVSARRGGAATLATLAARLLATGLQRVFLSDGELGRVVGVVRAARGRKTGAREPPPPERGEEHSLEYCVIITHTV